MESPDHPAGGMAKVMKGARAIVFATRLKHETEAHEYVPISPQREEPKLDTLWKQVVALTSESYLYWLLLAMPISFISYYLDLPSTSTFAFSCLALCPLAAILGDLTEDLALRYNEAIGALLNASFGNATELIISIFALKSGMYDIIKNSLVGSVLGNMMLVLGCAFLVSGLQRRYVHTEAHFSVAASHMYCAVLLLATMGMVIPSLMFMNYPNDPEYVLSTSRQTALLMILGYVLYVIFQLFTHKELFEPQDSEAFQNRWASTDPYRSRRMSLRAGSQEEQPSEPRYTTAFAMGSLLMCTILISFESEFLVDTLEPAAKQWGLTDKFISIILLPIVGNAAEHATAVTTAMKGKMDIALGVAIGSSIQISLLVVPLLVIISWAFGLSLDLNFELFVLSIMLMSVVVLKALVYSGTSNWLSGALLLLAYGMIAIALFNSREPHGPHALQAGPH